MQYVDLNSIRIFNIKRTKRTRIILLPHPFSNPWVLYILQFQNVLKSSQNLLSETSLSSKVPLFVASIILERTFASYLVVDYEKKPRIWISTGIIALSTPTTFLFTVSIMIRKWFCPQESLEVHFGMVHINRLSSKQEVLQRAIKVPLIWRTACAVSWVSYMLSAKVFDFLKLPIRDV
ncbi:unnamed protein product [Heligmosomoides polygyrus]|uniref:Dolichyl-P-Glc:Glc(2)Man(9)GlcNAc(2)-PP-dolichol alpha-1,2-glucosyltransferase n=1 Tax=Heligmosomoides polygyrus TaxID=6339 RepID=A0A183GJJ9_HELPZ|nr:unnamed protein product [Heligmosomoides polygyrus]